MDSQLFGMMAAVALWSASIAAQTVVDGDTIKLDGTTYRLWGIDAAETRQACADGWRAGVEASMALVEMMAGTRSPASRARRTATAARSRYAVPTVRISGPRW